MIGVNKRERFCPQCGSTDLYWYLGGKIGDQYKCRNCGYVGPAMEGDLKFISSFKKEKGLE